MIVLVIGLSPILRKLGVVPSLFLDAEFTSYFETKTRNVYLSVVQTSNLAAYVASQLPTYLSVNEYVTNQTFRKCYITFLV